MAEGLGCEGGDSFRRSGLMLATSAAPAFLVAPVNRNGRRGGASTVTTTRG